MLLNPSFVLNLIILSGILSIIFAYITGVQILSASSGNARMKEIAGAIQIGAKAYLNRQYKTIAIVGAFVLLIVSAVLVLLFVHLPFVSLCCIAPTILMVITYTVNFSSA